MPHLLVTAGPELSQTLVIAEELTPRPLADGHCRGQLAEAADTPHHAATFAGAPEPLALAAGAPLRPSAPAPAVDVRELGTGAGSRDQRSFP